MINPSRTYQELLEENSILNQRIKELEKSASELPQAKEALREREKRISLITDNMYDMIVEIDVEGRRTYVSPSHKTVLGIETSALLNEYAFLRIHPEDLQHTLEAFNKGIATGRPGLVSYRFLDSEGNYRWLESHGSPLFDSGHVLTGGVIVSRDITERKLAEEKLNNQMVFISTLLDTIPSPIFYKDTAGKYLGCNRAYEELIGKSREEVTGKDIHNIYPAEIAEVYAGKDRELYECPGHQTYDGKFKAADGTVRDVIINKATYTDTSNDVAGLVGVFIDITDRKQAEEALVESEERYRAISEYSHQAICIIDEQGKITWGNDKMQALGDYTREQIYGAESFIGFIAPESIEFVVSNFYKVLAGEPYQHHYTFYLIRRDGEKRLCDKYMMDFKDKYGKRNLIISMVDITDIRRAEENNRQKTDAMEAAIDGMALLNEEGKYIYLNKAHATVYGYDNTGELVGKSWKVLYDSDVLQRLEQEIMPEFSRKGYWHGEATGMKKNGTKFSQELSLTAMGNGGLICVVRDITARKLLESQLLQAQKMESIGTLSGGIAHDFNNILSAMVGYTELAMMEDDEKIRQDDLKQVLQACERATGLVGQILTFSRKSDVDKKPVNIGYIVKEVVKLIRSTIPTTIEVKQRIDSKSVIVLANHTQIHQIMMNLCANAAHAMSKKGGVMKIKLTPFEIASDSPLTSLDLKPGPHLKLEVSDTGQGIDPANVNRIFDPFFTTKELSEGTGLGLSVVYGIVKGHGGAIIVDSVLGSGSTFTVYIPAIPHQETKAETETEGISPGNEGILFVDDEPMLSALGRSMLQRSGYKVTDLNDSVQALEIFTENPDAYDIIITDMTMPCLTGLDLAKEIWKIRPHMPIILCTGHSNLINEEQAKKEGIRRFIMKPLRHRELARAVRDVLDEQRQPT